MNRRFQNIKKRVRANRGSMRGKLSLSLGAIAIVLLLASTISVLEYRRMSNYVTGLITANVQCINITQDLSKMCEEYNLRVLNAIGDESILEETLPDLEEEYSGGTLVLTDPVSAIDEDYFMAQLDTIGVILGTPEAADLIDSVKISYYVYTFTSASLKAVIESDFINARDWFFTTLEPEYDRLRTDIDDLSVVAYGQLQSNSETFEDSFYRSIIPGMVAAAVGLLLVLLLLFFLSIYYVNPIYKMLKNLKDSILSGNKYRYKFEGDDQLAELNDSIEEVVEENVDLRRRLRIMNEENESLRDAVNSAEE